MGKRRWTRDPVNEMFMWVGRQSVKVKIFLSVAAVTTTLILLKMLTKDRNHFFVASEAVHSAGIIVLVNKLKRKKSCSGLSLKTQEVTAMFLVVRLMCTYGLKQDIHSVLDLAALTSTLWVIYMIRNKLNSTYNEELDNFPKKYLVLPSILLAILVSPQTFHPRLFRSMWAFCVYLEAVSVLPQLRLMQNAKMVEPFTGHYVFALGVARFLGCAHWIIHTIDTKGKYLALIGSGYIWVPVLILTEAIQSFILGDFCYYYIKNVMAGQLLMRLPPV